MPYTSETSLMLIDW